MPTHDDLSSLPPAVLRAALVASEKREEVEKEKEKLQREIKKKLQKRLDVLEETGDTSEVELVRNIASGSHHKAKRLRVDSPSDEEVGEELDNQRWPIARAQRVDPIPVPPESTSCTRCRKKKDRCEWDKNSNIRRCPACHRSNSGCDRKRPISDT